MVLTQCVVGLLVRKKLFHQVVQLPMASELVASQRDFTKMATENLLLKAFLSAMFACKYPRISIQYILDDFVFGIDSNQSMGSLVFHSRPI